MKYPTVAEVVTADKKQIPHDRRTKARDPLRRDALVRSQADRARFGQAKPGEARGG